MARKSIGILSIAALILIALASIFAFSKSQKPIDISYVITPGDTLSSVFRKEHLTQAQLNKIIYQPLVFNHLQALKTHEKINLVLSNEHKLKSLSMPLGNGSVLIIEHEDNRYVPTISQGNNKIKTITVNGSVQKSLYQSLKNLGLSQRLTMTFIHIFSQDLKLAEKTHKGDAFSLTYAATFKKNKLIKTQLLVGSITIKNQTHTAILDDDNYYTAKGTNWAKAFKRVPVKYVYISSPFSPRRYHPILHRYRAHEGVDLAANIGTPIHATSNGKIIFAGKETGYGNVVILKYNTQYSTRYAHMKGFAKGIKVGKFVKEGQVIGYVGMTGLTTGPHVHYEFRVKNKPVNPMTVTLPQAPGLRGKQKAQFERYVTHLDSQAA